MPEPKEDAKRELPEGHVMRFDFSNLPGEIRRTDEGFIIADPVVTRTGVFEYQQPDGSIRREFRAPEEVFDDATMASAKLIPLTKQHPKVFVRPDNASKLAVGWTGENVRREGNNVRVPIKIATEDGIKAVEDGMRQLSLGYVCIVEQEDGEWDGERYTHRQRAIRYNHLALCHKARAGDAATLRLDASDAVMVESGEQEPGKRKETRKMEGKVRLDNGISYDCPPEVAAAVDAMRKDASDSAAKFSELQAKFDALQGTHDEAKAELEELKKTDHADAIREAAAARVALVSKVKPMVSEEVAAKMDAMSDSELMVEAIKSQRKDFDGSERSEDYIRARFDAAVESFEDAKKADADNGKKVVGDGAKREDEADPEVAREKMMARKDAMAFGKADRD